MKNKFLLLLCTAFMLLTGCQNAGKTGKMCFNDEKTPITDSLKLAQADQLDGKRFAGATSQGLDHYGYVSLRSCTDGDTANFTQADYLDDAHSLVSIKTRFLGVNTPESTAKVEPWGKKASLFTKHVLDAAQASADEENEKNHTNVCNIVLIDDVAVFNERDSSGNRWLAFIWYRKNSSSPWRNLNLELVELGYSKNQLFLDSEMCNYRPSFEKAENAAIKCGLRVHGQDDEDFDYTEKTFEYSLWGIKKHYQEIGITDEGKSGFQLIVTAMVVGMAGDSLFLRDVLIDAEQQEECEKNHTEPKVTGLYAYAGYNSSLCSTLQNASKKYGMDGTGIGLVIRFYCRATIYSNNIQLSDLKTGTSGKTGIKFIYNQESFEKNIDSFKWSAKYQNDELLYSDLILNTDSVELPADQIRDYGTDECRYTDLLAYQYEWITVTVTIRAVSTGDDDDREENAIRRSSGKSAANEKYWAKIGTDGKSCTVYAYITGKDGTQILTNLRIDQYLNPYVSPSFFYGNGAEESYTTQSVFDTTSEKSPVGKSFKVTGYLARYFEKFQIQLGNNYGEYNYLERL